MTNDNPISVDIMTRLDQIEIDLKALMYEKEKLLAQLRADKQCPTCKKRGVEMSDYAPDFCQACTSSTLYGVGW